LPYREISAQVPEFGGFFLDPQGNYHAFVTDTAKATDLRALLNPIIASRPTIARLPATSTGQLMVEQRPFTFLQLAGWRDALLRAASPIVDFQGIGVQLNINKVRVGVVSLAGLTAVQALLSPLQIPPEAVSIEIEERARELALLSDQYTPKVGGLEVTNYDYSGAFHHCTIGVNGNAGELFVIASHCTGRRGQVDQPPASAYQPDIGAGTHIGYEFAEGALFSSFEDWNCPDPQYHCSYADAAVFKYDSTVAPYVGQGYLAHTLFHATGYGNPGSVLIDGLIEILGDWTYPQVGDPVDKIGQASGWTTGVVTSPCYDIRLTMPYWYLCQVRADSLEALSGDSGAPVFVVAGSNRAYLTGLLHGGGLSTVYYSEIHDIWTYVYDFHIGP